MRVLIAPDKFAGTLGAVEAAEAIATGWRRGAPRDELDLAPVSDGGPGFIEVLRAAAGGETVDVTVTGPRGASVPAAVLCQDAVTFIEAAQACGLDHLAESERDPTVTTTYGVGELLALALQGGAQRCVVGLGGSATNDGGAGMLAALGAQPVDPLSRGGLGLRDVARVDLERARLATGGGDIVAATDVDNPLLGPHGASTVFGPQKGASPADVAVLESALEHWSRLTEPGLVQQPGAGAAGGLGYALFLLGGRRESGIEAVLNAIGLTGRVATADLVVTGEGSFDSQSLRGKAVSGVAGTARKRGVPCIVLAGNVAVGTREMTAAGIEAGYSVATSAGSAAAAMARPAAELAALAERAAGSRAWAACEAAPGE